MSKHTPGRRMDIALGAGAAGHQVMVVEYHTGCLIAGMTKSEAISCMLSAPSMLVALKKIDASWTESFPGGPDGDRAWCGGIGRLSEETVELWREIRAAIAKAEA